MNRKGYAKMDHTVFYAEQGSMSEIGYPDAGWYWDFAGTDAPDPHGPFVDYDTALADKKAYLSAPVSESNPF